MNKNNKPTNRVDEILKYENNGGQIIFCDCLYNGLRLVISFRMALPYAIDLNGFQPSS